MPDTSQSNAKIYPRPEKKAPSPVLLAVSVLLLLLVSFFAYRAFTNRTVTPAAQTENSVESSGGQRAAPAPAGR